MSALDVIVLMLLWQGAQFTLLLPLTRIGWEFLITRSDTVLRRSGAVFIFLGLVLELFSLGG